MKKESQNSKHFQTSTAKSTSTRETKSEVVQAVFTMLERSITKRSTRSTKDLSTLFTTQCTSLTKQFTSPYVNSAALSTSLRLKMQLSPTLWTITYKNSIQKSKTCLKMRTIFSIGRKLASSYSILIERSHIRSTLGTDCTITTGTWSTRPKAAKTIQASSLVSINQRKRKAAEANKTWPTQTKCRSRKSLNSCAKKTLRSCARTSIQASKRRSATSSFAIWSSHASHTRS